MIKQQQVEIRAFTEQLPVIEISKMMLNKFGERVNDVAREVHCSGAQALILRDYCLALLDEVVSNERTMELQQIAIKRLETKRSESPSASTFQIRDKFGTTLNITPMLQIEEVPKTLYAEDDEYDTDDDDDEEERSDVCFHCAYMPLDLDFVHCPRCGGAI